MGAKGTAIIFGGGVYVAENTFRGAQCRIVRLGRTTEARSAAPVPIGRSRPGDFIVKKGRRGPFLTVSGQLIELSFLLLAFLVVAPLVLASGLAFLAALDAGTLVVLLLAKIGQHAGLGTAALEALERVVQRLVFLDVDFRHCIPSLQNVRRRS